MDSSFSNKGATDSILAFERINEEVYYAGGGIVAIGPEEIEYVKARARENGRHRARICTHPSPQAALHEMFIVHERRAYVRPHTHVAKTESFWLVEGSCDLVLFSRDGSVDDIVPLGAGAGEKRYCRIPKGLFHTLLISSEWLVFHEVTTGPFVRAEMLFAPWAPDGDDLAAVDAYIVELEDYVRERRG